MNDEQDAIMKILRAAASIESQFKRFGEDLAYFCGTQTAKILKRNRRLEEPAPVFTLEVPDKPIKIITTPKAERQREAKLKAQICLFTTKQDGGGQ